MPPAPSDHSTGVASQAAQDRIATIRTGGRRRSAGIRSHPRPDAASGVWRWALIVATAATILLCINQQFSLRFFIDYTQLNTEYFYLLIALMLPFTFLMFPGTPKAPLDRIPWYDVLLFAAARSAPRSG